jgi:hypothetical protein
MYQTIAYNGLVQIYATPSAFLIHWGTAGNIRIESYLLRLQR